MDIIMRGSEHDSYLTCKKQWLYGWVEKITPKRPDNKLFIGTVGHKWMENYYKNQMNKLLADLETSVWLNEQDMSGMEQVDIDATKELIQGITNNYVLTYDDSNWKILATELEFMVLLNDGVYFTGTIDLVFEQDGEVYFSDHKFVTSLDMYEEKSKLDRQISRYWWALQMIADGIGRIKQKATREGEEDMWVRWYELEGKEIKGFIYNLIAKSYPKLPKTLKQKKNQIIPELSKDKSQKTNYRLYYDEIIKRGLDLNQYQDMLELLQNKPDVFLRRVVVRRNQKELQEAIMDFYYVTNDIHDTALALMQYPHRENELTYRHIGNHCDSMCHFKAICQAAIAGDNVQFVKNMAYKKNEDR